MPSARTLAGLVDSDSEDDLGRSLKAIQSSRAVAEMPASRKQRARTGVTASKVTKQAQKTTRRTSGRAKATIERQALAKKNENPQAGSAHTEDSGSTSGEVLKAKGVRGRPRTKTRLGDGAEVHNQVANGMPDAGASRRGLRTGRKGREVMEVAEDLEVLHPDSMDLDINGNAQCEPPPQKQPAVLLEQSVTSSQDDAVDRWPYDGSDMDRADSADRKQLREMTKKYEALESKYRELRDVGINEAEGNFDRFKKHADEQAKTANQLISNLKTELAAQTTIGKGAQLLKKQLEASEENVDGLRAELAESANLLLEARTEIKSLLTKLAASRTLDAANTKAPGSAMKGISGGGRLGNMQEVAQLAQIKENLYRDLTGLIVRAVKQDVTGPIFDCIQTGRNGTLHFKLATALELSGETYEEAQVTYLPQLDPSRDRELMGVLPDFLIEDITFPLQQAAKFYARVTKCLTEAV